MTLRAQSDDGSIDDALAEALAEASDWPEVRVPLLNTLVVRALYLGQDPSGLIDDLEREATRYEMRALQALAMIRRIDQVARVELAATSLETLAEIRLLLDDDAQPARDRISGLIGLAATCGSLQLHGPADDLMRDALIAVEQLDESDEGRAVCLFNRALNTIDHLLAAAEAGRDDAAREALRRFEQFVSEDIWERHSAAWRREFEGYHRLAVAVLDDIWYEPDEVARLVADLDDECELHVLLQLVTPADRWSAEPDLDQVFPPKDTIVQFLYARALEHAYGSDAATVAAREHARCLAAQAWSVRDTAGEALTARITALRAAAEHTALRLQTLTDPLTAVCNRRAFESLIDRFAGEPATVVSVDLDDFKRVNDRWGHDVGDAVLERVARALASAVDASVGAAVGPIDDRVVLARVGGDEFAAFALGADEARVGDLTRALRGAVDRIDWTDLLGSHVQHCAVGAACGACGPELVASADREMYAHKAAERGADRSRRASGASRRAMSR